MSPKRPTRSKKPRTTLKTTKRGNPVSKGVKVSGKRSGSIQAANQRRQQGRRDAPK